jgi:glycosyltransferase involved in cell wall biosynthesis
MRIIVNNIAASSGGALSILKSFYNYLVKTEANKENEWIFLLSDRYIEETDNIKVIVLDEVKKKWISRLKFDIYSGKKLISSLNPDVVFSLQNTITFGLNCPQVLYMHQSIPFQKEKTFSFIKSEERILAIYQHIIGKLIKESIKRADKTVVQTKWIRDAVIETTNVSNKKVVAVFPPLEDNTKYTTCREFKKNSFFYPAANSIYKNHKCIYNACDLLRLRGIIDYDISLTIEGENNNENISYLGNIPFEKVMEKYNSSTLIFPSYIETVGLPLIEARQMGTIILAADSAFSREALDGYENAYFFDPFNPQKLSVLMEKVITGQLKKIPLKDLKKKSSGSWKSVVEIIEHISGEKA